jgi:glycosyltransferase involved in cell wall biosynthesis
VIVLIPAYEPDGRLPALVDALRTASPDVRLVVVDDGSGADRRQLFDVVRAMGCPVLEHPVNRGKGAALKTGFAFIARHWPGEDVVCADSDGQHSVVDILRVAEAVRRGQPLVLGVRRFSGDVPARSRFGNSLTRILFRLATGRRVVDTQTGLRGYAHSLLGWLREIPGDRFEYELNVLLRAARARRPIGEVEIATIYLEGNASSHFRPVVDSVRIYGPLLSFLLSSFAAFLLDTAALLTFASLTGSLLLSVVAARLLSSATNFAVNRRVVFASRTSVPACALRYAALAAVLLSANYALLASLTGLGLALFPAKLLTEALLLAGSYQAQRRIVFAPRLRQEPPAAVTGVERLAHDGAAPARTPARR